MEDVDIGAFILQSNDADPSTTIFIPLTVSLGSVVSFSNEITATNNFRAF